MVNGLPSPLSAAIARGMLIVVSDSAETARSIESRLRNAGHPLRTAWVADAEQLDELLRRGAPDLLLAEPELRKLPMASVLSMCARLAPDLPIVALADQASRTQLITAMSAGARDLVSAADDEAFRHLERVCLRELEAHRHLRELRASQRRLADFEARHLNLLQGTADAIVHIQEGILSHVNPAFARLIGYDSADELMGHPLMDLVRPEQQPKVKEHLKLLAKGKLEGQPLSCALRHRDGSSVDVSAQLTRGTVDGEDFIEWLIRAETLQRQVTPADVNMPGRIAFFRALSGTAMGRPDDDAALSGALMVVVDQFSRLETQVGLEDVERLMIRIGERLGTLLTEPGDRRFRFSTQEFAAIVSRSDAVEMERLAARICKDFARSIVQVDSHEVSFTVSVAAYALLEEEPPSLIAGKLAHAARQLSAMGGNQISVLGPAAASQAGSHEDQRTAEMVKKALEDGRLRLAYQSIASLEGDTRQHYDVLLRLIDPTGAEMYAAEFIRVAEKFGLMKAIDRWVVMRALRALVEREAGRDNSMLFVKLSEQTLKDADGFMSWLTEAQRARPLQKNEICFEFQELSLQAHIGKGRALASSFAEIGAAVAIEHFGIGSNPAQLLDHVPVQFLKFDRSFTHNFNEKPVQKRMSQLMEIAKQRGIKTIVSHVEDANVMARMWQMGVNFIQGYHVQEPEVVLLSAERIP